MSAATVSALTEHRLIPGASFYADSQCAGCDWLGWDHTAHLAAVIDPIITAERADAAAVAWDEGAATRRMEDGSEEPVDPNPYRKEAP